MSVNAIRGAGIGLPPNVPALLSGVSITLGAGPITLAAGETFVLPAGTFYLTLGANTFFQVKDPYSGNWKTFPAMPNNGTTVQSDGVNMRLANLTGCLIGGLLTNVGTGYTSAPTVTTSAGTGALTAIVGGAVSATVTLTTAGAGYVHAPMLVVAPPPTGGVQATAIATVSAGAISAVTVINQGAGYTAAPVFYVFPDPRDTITTPAVLTSTLAGAGTITALLRTDHGQPVTAVPTISFAGGGGSGAAATAVMCFAATGFTVGTAGAGYGTTQPFAILTSGGVVAGTPGAVVNPALDKGAMVPRQAGISGTTGAGVITATGAVITDPGQFQAVPNGLVVAGGTGLATTVGQVTITVGGVSDTSWLYPI